jgi:hypothetical protein
MAKKNLTPPMQNDPGIHIFDPDNRYGVPYFRFATIELSENSLQADSDESQKPTLAISTAIPEMVGTVLDTSLSDDDTNEDDMEIENVHQTYSVQIPYNETIDGKQITRVRTETRSRIVPIKRKKVKYDPSADGEPPIQQAYTISVPYTEQVELEDGTTMTVTRSRLETRTRWVVPGERTVRFAPKVLSNSVAIDLAQCFDRSGLRLTPNELMERLKETSKPALIVNSADHIVPYFLELLGPEVIIVVDSWMNVTADPD